MSIEVNLNPTGSNGDKIAELKRELMPRGQCVSYVAEEGEGKATLVSREEFDNYIRNKEFQGNPFIDGTGQGYGEQYVENPQAMGKLKDGRVVYCEVSEAKRKQFEELERLLGEK